MIEKIPRLSSDQRSNLVAYLDGELPEPAAKEIEQVLSKSPTVQHDVEMLSRTWDLLDQLPRLTGNSDLTERMVSLVKAGDEPSLAVCPLRGSSGFRRSRCVAGRSSPRGWLDWHWRRIAGFFVTNRLIPDPSEPLLRNLPVIEKLDLYSNVESIDFLHELDKRAVPFNEPKSNTP